MLNVVRATAAPLPLRVGGRWLLVAPPPIEMKSMLIAWLANHPAVRLDYWRRHESEPPPGWLPRCNSNLAVNIFIEEGMPLLVYATTRKHHPDLDMGGAEEVAELVMNDPEALQAISQIATMGMMSRDIPESMLVPESERKSNPDGYDGIESIDFGKILECQQLRRFSPGQIAAMTQDQLENAIFAGKLPDPQVGRPLSFEAAFDYLQECRRAKAEGREIPQCP